MFKKTLSIGLLGVLTTSSAFALDLFTAIKKPQIKKQLHAVPNKNIKSADSFTDFSGNWEGTCSGTEGEDEPYKMIIQSDKDELIVNYQPFSINSLTSLSTSSQEGIGKLDIAVDWDKEKLIGKAVYVSKFYESSTVNTQFFKLSFALNNGQLIYTQTESSFKDLELEGNPQQKICKLNKVQ